MKKLNKNIAIAIVLGLSSISYVSADMEMSDTTNYMKTYNEGQMTTTPNFESLKLKGKIDGYKVVLNWSPYVGEDELLGYRVEFSGPDGSENTLSVGADKTTLDNWDAKAGENKYQVFAVGSEGDLKESNEIVLKMGPNGGYDFSGKTQSGSYKKEIKQEYKEKIEGNKDEMKKNLNDFKQENGAFVDYLSGYTQEQKDQLFKLRDENQKKINAFLMKLKSPDLSEEDIAYVKGLIETTSADYLAQVKEIVGENEEALKFLELRKEVFKENQKLRDENKELRKEMMKEKFGSGMTKPEMGSGEMFKEKPENFQNMRPEMNQMMGKNSDLKQKYKKVFAKSLESKLENLSVDRLKIISSKIDTLIEKYSSMDMDETKKEKTIAQLQAVKEIIDDKLTTSEDMIDIDSLLNDEEMEDSETEDSDTEDSDTEDSEEE